MNITEANEILERAEQLLSEIRSQLPDPKPTFGSSREFTLEGAYFEDGLIRANWSRYVGCGEYDHETTYHNLNKFFKEQQ